MEYTLAAYTDIGLQKEVNQDSVCLRRARSGNTGEIVMAVVCDGMGGLQKGEVASAECVMAFGNWFDQHLAEFDSMCAKGTHEINLQWNQLLQAVHQRILQYSEKTNASMGTTVAALFACGNYFLVANVGDTRAYSCRQTIQRLTQDHSLVAREVALGHITEAEARSHPQRNILLQCIGQGQAVVPSFVEGRLQSDMLFFLCTDGYTHTFSDEEFGEALPPLFLTSKENMVAALTSLANQCKSAGETDNLTGVLVHVRENTIPKAGRKFRDLFHRKDYAATPSGQKSQPILLETAQLIHTNGSIQ